MSLLLPMMQSMSTVCIYSIAETGTSRKVLHSEVILVAFVTKKKHQESI